MDDKRFDQDLETALKRGTDDVVQQKEKVWENIQSSIHSEGRMGRKMRNRKRSMISGIIGTGAIAAALLIAFFGATQPGQAAIDKVRELFAPEKKIVENIEGTKESTNAVLQKSQVGYIIYFDEKRYTMEKLEGKDRIVPLVKAKDLPEVYMEIQQIKDKKPDAVISDLEKELKGKYSEFRNIGPVQQPIKGTLLFAASGDKWNDTVEAVYVMDNMQGGTFIFRQHYFREASEGHGARFENMLKEFKIVPAE